MKSALPRRRTVEDQAADRAVLAALRARRGTATRADLVVDTALPEMVVERAVTRLLDQYDSRVGVARGGVLIYRFDPAFRRRAERRVLLHALLGAAARSAGAVVRGARAVFRAVLAVQLIVYVFLILLPVSVVVGVIAGIVFLVLALFSEGGGDLLAALADPYVAAVVLGIFVLIGIGWALKKKYELLLELVGVKPLDARAGGVAGLVARVNAFAVGPDVPRRRREHTDRTTIVSRADEGRVLARIRAAGGRLRAGDLVRWLGLSLDTADAQTTRFLVEYGGEPTALTPQQQVATDDSDVDAVEVFEARFPSLLATTGPVAPASRAEKRGGRRAADEPTAFERADPPPVFSGNPRRADGFVALFAVVNLGAGLVGWHLLGPRAEAPGSGFGWDLAWCFGALLPVGFSLLLLGLPLVRAPLLAVRKARRIAALARGRLVAALAAHAAGPEGREPLDLDALVAALPTPDDQVRLSGDEARAVALELGGEFDLDQTRDPPKTVWRFRRLAAELAPGAPATPAAPAAPAEIE